MTARLRAEDALREGEACLRLLVEQLPTVLWSTDQTLRFTTVSGAGLENIGCASERAIGVTLYETFNTADHTYPPIAAHLGALAGTPSSYEYTFEGRTFQAHVEPFRNEAGEIVGCLGMALDFTEHKEAERKTALQAEFRRNLIELMEESLHIGLDEHFYQRLLEGAVKVIPGAESGSLLVWDGQRYGFTAAVGFDLGALQRCFFSPDELQRDQGSAEPQLLPGYRKDDYDETQREVMETVGALSSIEATLSIPIFVEGENIGFFNLDNFSTSGAFDAEAVEMARVFAQQTAALLKRFALEKKLVHLANHDALTGLPNRRLFHDRLGLAVAQSRRSGCPLAVMFLDLDNFKDVNDTYGHDFGDALIRAVAERLSACLRDGDTLALWGGDKFVLLLNVEGVEGAVTAAERLLAQLRHPLIVSGREFRTGASIGIELYTGGLEVAEDLVKHADIALYRARVARGSYEFFDKGMTEKLRARVEIGEELRAALDAGTLTLYYQPRVELATGRVTSLEALARWPHPQQGFIPPSTFIPLAEELGLIRTLGAQILDLACAQSKVWEAAGTPYRVAVNLSVEQLKHPGVVTEVSEALRRHKLDPALLELEITESTAMTDVEDAIVKMRQLRELGVHLSIDDFGTAYSSLAYLKQLPVHSLKIDRAFVKGLGEPNAASEASIVQAVVALARSFKLNVVAEGVEAEAQRLALWALGCDEAQGYLFAKPLPPDEVTGLLTKESNIAPSLAAPAI